MRAFANMFLTIVSISIGQDGDARNFGCWQVYWQYVPFLVRAMQKEKPTSFE